MSAILTDLPLSRLPSGLFRSFVKNALPSRFVTGSALTLTMLLIMQICLILIRLNGNFVYTLDDPYIHLALAAQIAQGHYGLSSNAFSSPSSSILYPFLLAPLLLVGLGSWAAMSINAITAIANASVFAMLIEGAFPEVDQLSTTATITLSGLGCLALNLAGVAMTGMEHGLQITLTLLWLLGALRFLRRSEVAWWWWLSAALGPFVRYEAVTLWLATVVLLFLSRRGRSAFLLLGIGGVGLSAFSLFLHLHGLAWLPSSVLVKSALTASGSTPAEKGPLYHILWNALRNINGNQGIFLTVTIILLTVIFLRKIFLRGSQGREARALCLIGLWVSLAQILVGRVDGFSRYSIYALALDSAIILTIIAPDIRQILQRRSRITVVAISVVGLFLFLPLASLNAHRSLRSDMAAQNIYEQQYQMRRLAVDYFRGPVAVNDLGLVSFNNPFLVEDLWGLGSEEARIARSSDRSGAWMASFVDRHNVGLVMIYDQWFAHIPDKWVLCAILNLGSVQESVGGRAVSIYATGPEQVARVDVALHEWEVALPPDIHLLRHRIQGSATDGQ